MNGRNRWHGSLIVLLVGMTALLGAEGTARTIAAQQPKPALPTLVFDSVIVVDVERGTLVPDQRVVIAGNRIQALGSIRAVPIPNGAQVVEARGKYLIPGLWDLHTHAAGSAGFFYPLFLANGVTGIRDAGSPVPLDTLLRWRREILAGTRIGPPRQLLSGQSIGELGEGMWESTECHRSEQRSLQTCVTDTADARHYVDSLHAAGADLVKPRDVTREVYFAVAAEARRLGIPFGGHITHVTAREATDSGARIVDHLYAGMQIHFMGQPVWESAVVDSTEDLNTDCWSTTASVEQCQTLAERFRRNGTWWVPTLVVFDGGDSAGYDIVEWLEQRVQAYWADSLKNPFAMQGGAAKVFPSLQSPAPAGSAGALATVRRVGLPLLAGTDVSGDKVPFTDYWNPAPGFSLHAELAIYVADGLSPLEALQAATLNPARLWHATDSLGTVAPGKLADLVLLDGNPLADITNTTQIRAVVANGRYFDRAALDQLLAQARAAARAQAATTAEP